jgi:DNA invertase Pin-like site-specific DNA recombinase
MLPSPRRQAGWRVEPFTDDCDDLRERSGTDAESAFDVMRAFAQFERELIRERQREGIAIAKREGKYRGRKPSLAPARAAELRRRVAPANKLARIAWAVLSSGQDYRAVQEPVAA